MEPEKTRQQAWVDRNAVNFRSVELKPDLFNKVKKLKEDHGVTLLDIVKQGLIYFDKKYK